MVIVPHHTYTQNYKHTSLKPTTQIQRTFFQNTPKPPTHKLHTLDAQTWFAMFNANHNVCLCVTYTKTRKPSQKGINKMRCLIRVWCANFRFLLAIITPSRKATHAIIKKECVYLRVGKSYSYYSIFIDLANTQKCFFTINSCETLHCRLARTRIVKLEF